MQLLEKYMFTVTFEELTQTIHEAFTKGARSSTLPPSRLSRLRTADIPASETLQPSRMIESMDYLTCNIDDIALIEI
jgi:hypothetical protein